MYTCLCISTKATRLMIGTVVLLLLALLSRADAQEIVQCPAFKEAPKAVEVDQGGKREIKLENAHRKTLCMLVHVRHTDPSKEGTDIDFTDVSPGPDFIVTPVARSFEEGNWARVAGDFSRSKDIKIRKCNKVASKTCLVTLKRGQSDKGRFFLITEKHKRTPDEKVSRFLMQTTFGPTKSMISQWQYNVKTSGFASWVKDQMELTPTKHREFFRSKADYVSSQGKIGLSNVEVQHPCSSYSRWRRHTFTEADNGKNVDVWSTGVNYQYAVLIDGVLRTVVDEFRAVDNSFNGHASYQLCWRTGAKVGGIVEVMPRGTFQCRALAGGNPVINLNAPTGFSYYMRSLKFIDLPSMTNFELMPSVVQPSWGWGNYRYDHESYKLKSSVGISNAECDAVTLNDYSTVVGRMPGNNEYLWFSGYANLLENSVESPLADGGLQSISKGAYNCANAPMSYENADTCFVATGDACEASTHGFFPWRFDPKTKKNVVVCGSEGEVGKEKDLDPSEAGAVQPYGTNMASALFSYPAQKRNVQYMIFLKARDQLRQRMAWALSQICAISPNQIATDDEEAEPYLKYYDIFVKHAFGNYRDVLRDVAYSPMMAEMLSFLESKSASFVLKSEGRVSRPDENFAREIMQLFSIGLYELRMDGSVKKDSNGVPILTYSNSDIQTFARAWTGFKRETRRFNREGIIYTTNRIDPMAIFGKWRDPFPKMDLDGGFIGDGYPLCTDLPSKQFLRVGAQYRLLGSAPRTKMQYETLHANFNDIKRIKLDTNSKLYEKLCNFSNGACDFKPIITLDENLQCTGKECEIDNLNAVIVQDDPNHPLKYEYVRPACVEQAFYDSAALKKITSRQKEVMCLHENIDDVAMDACCLNPIFTFADYLCEFSYERTSYATGQSRCQSQVNFPSADTCDWSDIRLSGSPHIVTQCQAYLHTDEISWHWTNQGCSIKAKVNSDGLIATVHDPATLESSQQVSQSVGATNINFFKVAWDNADFPSAANQCANNACTPVASGCLCDVAIYDEKVFDSYPKQQEVIDQLRIGSPSPDSFDVGTYTLAQQQNGVSTYHKQGEDAFSVHTIFSVNIRGRLWYYKNMKSTVSVVGGSTTYQFRNPPQFLSTAKPDTRDATYETEAVLDYYFNHRNTPPFLATRILQRFGISNPSPKQIQRAAKAFRDGRYSKSGTDFGDGKYGNLGALIASIVLDKEATSTHLDADPSGGSLREPLLKVMSFLRAMEYEYAPQFPTLMMEDLQDNIGQEAQNIPNVFSFFLPEFSPPGKLAEAGLTAPEAQVLNAPKILGLLNGFYSLIDIGLSKCYGGFGDLNTYGCDLYLYSPPEDLGSRGFLTYTPTNQDPSEIVDEMALLLTGGQRLDSQAKGVIVDAYVEAGGGEAGIKMIQKLLVSTPEFHAKSVVKRIDTARPQSTPPQPSSTPYKSIVYVNLMGGLDSFNVLVPHSGCSTDMYSQYQSVRGQVALHHGSLLEIDATGSGQVCTKFGLHGSLTSLKSLYDDGDLVFLSNVGVLSAPATKQNWQQTQKTALFSHNTQQEEISYVDFWDGKDGRGVGGRMVDMLSTNDFKPGSISISGLSTMLRGLNVSQTVSDASGYQQFNPSSVLSSDITSKVRELNGLTTASSSFYGETWSDSLFQTLDENELLFNELQQIDVTTTFPDTDLGGQLEAVAKLMKTKDVRGTDRDIFYTAITGFDMHAHIAVPLVERLDTINNALDAFVDEMKVEGLWEDVAVVFVSEFARTLMGNTGNGTDHAWGGNYFVASGSADGGKIIGNYPSDLRNSGPQVFEGVVVPEWSWEALWNGLAEWFGIDSADDLTNVIPNRGAFANMWSASDIFTST